ncbi:PucR family transcriptional regulator [Pseudonocardia acidicola]|uniref:PucR family transcriptional regulator n=1 Tax=Pseudonocardia acidicola TaxID=2724939 RepID=A0ABX1SG00_9PSEU|nr:helix-turn-helix domain-containing protein [Pseudonocardia acidicola]NMI00482.1 PucR family transcriptional regulator [Pseudonocardia acidicola]
MNAGGDNARLRDLVSAIVDRMPAILDEVRVLLEAEHPDYAAFLAEEIDEVVAVSEGYVGRLVGLVENPTASAPGAGMEQALFEEIGRLHHRQGRDITSLLAAYRIGATVAWRHVAESALQLGIPVEAFAALAGAVFAAVDQLSTASLHGYVQAQSDDAHARERLREELGELLLSDRSDSAAVRAAAARADWPMPRGAAVIVVDPDNEVGRASLARLDDSCLRVRRPDALIAIVPDPSGPGRRSRLAEVLRGTAAVVGAGVPLDRLPASLHFAELAVRLRRARVLDDDPLFVDEHLDAIIVHHDERLLAALRRQYLAPLDSLPEPTRERLAATLTSWLMHMGNRQAVAAELHVHPQTVRYRLAQLRELFGSALADPASRATLLLALAWGAAEDDTGEQRAASPRPAHRDDAARDTRAR